MLGPKAWQKITLNLDPTGETTLAAIAFAGGSKAFVGKTPVQKDGLLSAGRKKLSAQNDVMLAGAAVIYTDALQAEAAAFATILAKSGKMSCAQIQEWLCANTRVPAQPTRL